MLYVFELPQSIQEALLTILKKHLAINEMIQYYDEESEILLNSKIDDIQEFLNLIDDLEF